MPGLHVGPLGVLVHDRRGRLIEQSGLRVRLFVP
jgi:hypothetical protein